MNFTALMEQLKNEYLLELPGKIQALEKNLQVFNPQFLSEDFHKLKGTGKTYGIPEISELSEVMEKICLNKSPDLIHESVKQALFLFQEIYRHRMAQKPFDLSMDNRFTQLKNLII